MALHVLQYHRELSFRIFSFLMGQCRQHLVHFKSYQSQQRFSLNSCISFSWMKTWKQSPTTPSLSNIITPPAKFSILHHSKRNSLTQRKTSLFHSRNQSRHLQKTVLIRSNYTGLYFLKVSKKKTWVRGRTTRRHLDLSKCYTSILDMFLIKFITSISISSSCIHFRLS